MPIYEYYCPDNHTVYQFYAKTLAQGRLTPKCPDNPGFRMVKTVSAFAIKSGAASEEAAGGDAAAAAESGDDVRMDAAMQAMETEFAGVDENDPRAMARMMRKMSELTGERIDGEMEEVVRKLEEGADPDSLEEQFGGGEDADGGDDPSGEQPGGAPAAGLAAKESRHRFKPRRPKLRRDPKLYDYE